MTNLELADKLQYAASSHYGDLCGMLWGAGAALRNLHTENTALRVTEDNLRQELQECQDQRRVAFRRIEELDAMRAQIGHGVPMAWKWRNIKTDSEGVHLEDPKTVGIDVTHPAYEWTPLYTHPEPQQKPLTDEQIQKWWASENGLEDCIMSDPYDFTKVVRAIEAAHNIGEKK